MKSGFSEVAHTADLAIRVWAEDIEGLLVEAVRGMFSLMKFELADNPSDGAVEKVITICSEDAEELLVSFLTELLYRGEIDRRVYLVESLQVDQTILTARLSGRSILGTSKEIKAVTYHNLSIKQTDQGLETIIVFDV